MAPEPSATPVPGPLPMDVPLKLAIARLAHGVSPASLAQAQADWLVHLGVSPARQAELWASALRKSAQWWQQGAASLAAGGRADGAACLKDRRFSKPGWEHWPFASWA
jgi:polyhydroxyalkanoate synthase subunit PhaC